MSAPMRDKTVRRMGLICLVGFGGFMLWSTIAPLEEGIAAIGKIIVEDDRQLVQHFEGGIIENIQVREGDMVDAGQPLLILQTTASRSVRNQVVQEAARQRAALIRLEGLLNGNTKLDFSMLDQVELGTSERDDIIRRERALFSQERASLSADLSVLNARITASAQVEAAKANEITIAQRALAAANSERDVVQAMVSEQLARRNQLTSADRMVAAIEGDISRLGGEQAEAKSLGLDLRAQTNQARARASQRWAESRSEASGKLQAAEEQLRTAQDILDRSVVLAPVAGEVLNLVATTEGGVIRSGDILMEIVPQLSQIIATVQVLPQDRPSVITGQRVRTQLSSYKGWQAPRLNGEIIGVSADLKRDPVTGADYYEARILIPQSEIARVEGANILPGLPVDAFIYSGKSRTLMEYLLEPVSDSLFRGLRQG